MAGAPWRGRIFLDAGLILYVGPGAGADEHTHNSVQLVWSPDEPFEITIAGRRLERTAVLVPANSVHTLDASGRMVALLLVESHGERGANLNRAAEREAGRDLAAGLASTPFPRIDLDAREVASWCDGAIGALGVEPHRFPITATTRRAIRYIEDHLDGVPRVAELARRLRLSETRVTHVFTREVGIPFRRFVLWTRIKRAVSAHQSGCDLTAASIAAGFSDAAHFSRTFRAMFGLSPSLVLAAAEITGSVWSEPDS